MFAFAIYDRRPTHEGRRPTVGDRVLGTAFRSSASGRPFSPRGRLLLVRDRLGIKPLYYYQDGTRFVFGSEIKSILASGPYSPDMSPARRRSSKEFFRSRRPTHWSWTSRHANFGFGVTGRSTPHVFRPSGRETGTPTRQ
jgi:hypothetical protein